MTGVWNLGMECLAAGGLSWRPMALGWAMVGKEPTTLLAGPSTSRRRHAHGRLEATLREGSLARCQR